MARGILKLNFRKIILAKKSLLPVIFFDCLGFHPFCFGVGSACSVNPTGQQQNWMRSMGDRFQRLEMQKSCTPTWEVLPTTWNTFLFFGWNFLMAWPASCYDVWCRGYWTPGHLIFFWECFTGWNTVFPWYLFFAISRLFSVFGDLPTPSTMNPLNNWILMDLRKGMTSGRIIATSHDLTPKGS